ncbi:hypothetical protein RRG08_052344 [Elysia crispata]|uniref:Uncharacterized protein n=1 Tax=Elysia crispata TaxID=231223 RepID=A0AAE1A696_9GAST|nr:hypothetical protein RRG08_052344 [Elysia crispata]
MIIITITWDDKSLLALTKSDHSKIWSVLAAVVSSKSTLPSTESSRSSEPIYIIRKKALRPLELINGWTLSIVKERNSYILHQLPNGRSLLRSIQSIPDCLAQKRLDIFSNNDGSHIGQDMSIEANL